MSQKVKRGIILMNLGSPDSTRVSDVRRYLNEFLMDGRVIDSPYLVRSVLVKVLITPARAPKSAEAYETIWTKEGSPLVVITKELQKALQAEVSDPVVVAMRYGNPNMKSAYDKMLAEHPDVNEVVLFPLYPHYAMSSYETAVEHAKAIHKQGNYPFTFKVVPPFYNNPEYIAAMAASIKPHLDSRHLLFSYHSIPERHIRKSDPTGSHCLKSADCCTTSSEAHKYCYRHQCYTTTKLITEALGIPKDKYSIAFQSKLGRSAWLTPATTARMQQLPAEGTKDLLVVCPSFVSDCLETLEEIEVRERENFLNAGGRSFHYVPCMNTQPIWIQTVKHLITTAV